MVNNIGHYGPCFGPSKPLTPEQQKERDELIDSIASIDPEDMPVWKESRDFRNRKGRRLPRPRKHM